MASVTAVTASPSIIPPGGAQSTIRPTISNVSSTSAVTITLDDSSDTAHVALIEDLIFGVDPTKAASKGYVYCRVDSGGTVAVGEDGVSFVFTSS